VLPWLPGASSSRLQICFCPTVGGLETETLCKKECKNKKTDIFSTVNDGWGHDYYLMEALCLTKSSFSFLGMLIF
jgi:hypothetical protein